MSLNKGIASRDEKENVKKRLTGKLADGQGRRMKERAKLRWILNSIGDVP